MGSGWRCWRIDIYLYGYQKVVILRHVIKLYRILDPKQTKQIRFVSLLRKLKKKGKVGVLKLVLANILPKRKNIRTF